MTTFIRSRGLALLAGLAVLVLLAVQQPSPVGAVPLTNLGWSVSNSQISSADATYSWQFTPATTATLESITMTVPAGTTWLVPAIAATYGIGAGSVGLAGTTVTYTVTVPAPVNSGTPIYIELSGFTNTDTAGDYTSDVTTVDAGGPVDTGTSPVVTFGANSTAATVVVSKSMTVTNDTAAFTLLMDPGAAALSDLNKSVTLNVKTNAGSGYTLNVKAGLLTSGGLTIPAISTGKGTGVATGSFTPNTFGYKMSAIAGNASGVAVQGAGLSVANDYVGYTAGGEDVAIATGPTGAAGDTVVLNNRVAINYDTPSGVYTSTITYTVTPSY
jgi:hypothetical protein